MKDSRPSGSVDPVGFPEKLSQGGLVGGRRFVLKKLLGQGGMGVVWLAHDLRLKELVALKFLPLSFAFDPVAVEDLRKETLRSRKLSHPNIVRIHDLYEASGETTFISMEYVDGPNLHYLRAHRPGLVLSWKFLMPLLRELCGALEYAHHQRVLHRDLKPANLMLDSNGTLKLADFGLSCVLHDGGAAVSGQGYAHGTLAYMSPQQADGRKPEVTDDIYSLGATLYELLTSRPPFYAGDVGYQIRNNRPPHMHERLADLELVNDIPSEAAAMVMACLAKEPGGRPQRASQILEWIDSAEGAPARVNPTLREDLSAEKDHLATSEPESDLQGSRAKGRPLLMAGVCLLCVLLLQFWIMRSMRANRAEMPAMQPGAAEQSVEAGFEKLFNGKNLSGWSSEPAIWSVQDGVIRGHLPASNPERRSWLIWRQGVASNFELRAECRLIYGKAGILYRGKELAPHKLSGYESAISPDSAGEMVSLGSERSYTLTRPAKESSPGVSWAAWVEIEVVAEGNHLIHKVNGNVVGDARDGPSWAQPLPGLIALELLSGDEDATAEFRNIRIKRGR